MRNLKIYKIQFPDSPIVGTSTRRNCPCCEETLNFAGLDTPTPKIPQPTSSVFKTTSEKDIKFRVLFKNYSCGNIVKVVRRKPPTPITIKNLKNVKLEEFFGKKKKIKRISVRPKQKSLYSKKNPLALNKSDIINLKIEESHILRQSELDEMWKKEENKMKKIGGLTKLQKVLKRTNLPPLASSIKDITMKQQLRLTKSW